MVAQDEFGISIRITSFFSYEIEWGRLSDSEIEETIFFMRDKNWFTEKIEDRIREISRRHFQ